MQSNNADLTVGKDNDSFKISKELIDDLLAEYEKIERDNEQEENNFSSIFGRKHTYCVRTADGQKHQFKEYSILAHAKCIQLGVKYGTPATLSKGECKTGIVDPQ